MTDQVLRGECKIPGGKFVTVDLVVDGDMIVWAAVAGDFFLDPDEALAVIEGALVGLPAGATVSEVSAAIDARLADAAEEFGYPATLVGFNPWSVGVAVRRALGREPGGEVPFEVLRPGPLPIRTNVALDEVLCYELMAGNRGATLRFWEWPEEERAVVIGSFQSVANEVDPAGVDRHGVTVVRRISGGGAMFMEGPNCITFSLVVPQEMVEGMSFEASYWFLNSWLVSALEQVGVQAELSGLNDISTPHGKIAGSAQKRFVGGAVLHHVTMAYGIDDSKMHEVLRIGKARLRPKGAPSAVKRVDPLRSQTGLPRLEIIDQLDRYFRTEFRSTDSELWPAELAQAEALVESKFATDEWQNRVP